MLAQVRESLGDVAYARHQSEQTLLYQLFDAHFPALVNQLAQQGKSLRDHVQREFEAHLKSGRLEHGFLRVRCDICHLKRLAYPLADWLFGDKKINQIPRLSTQERTSPGLMRELPESPNGPKHVQLQWT